MKRSSLTFLAGVFVGAICVLVFVFTAFNRLSARIYYNTMTGGTKSGVYLGGQELIRLFTPMSTLEGVRVPLDFDIDKIDDYWVQALAYPLYVQRSANTDSAFSYRAIILISEVLPLMSTEKAQATKVELMKLLQAGNGVSALEFAKQVKP